MVEEEKLTGWSTNEVAIATAQNKQVQEMMGQSSPNLPPEISCLCRTAG
jgi:hypothetical protein